MNVKPLAALLLGVSLLAAPAVADEKKKNQPVVEAPVPLSEAAAKMTVPEGFRVTLCAGEPEVRQPIAFTIDDRGRLWVAECYSYPNWKETGRDRLLVFEDVDGDGRFDKRTVFWDKFNYLTGVQVGFGGVWACSAPNLYFIPDKDGDAVPDGDPVVKLDGWSNKGVHNVFNTLTWAPDGWLWGTNGITGPSRPGKPGTAEEDRLQINCGVWRYHPLTEKLEVVCHGTTNPWGLDFNDYGEGFITNCVIGHLFHVIPGAHYERMFGQDYNKHVFDLIAPCSDHLHWGGGKWTDSRGGGGAHSEAGGGHAHCGAMIYLGDNWPDEYRNSILMGNIHGKRLNRDTLHRQGSGYVGKHAQDFLLANDEWFRPIAMTYGPDGAVYVIDWSDTGECHEKDAHGAHHDSGRIYKITYRQTQSATNLDLAKRSNEELVKLQLHKNDWYVRHARRLLQERSAAGADMGNVHRMLRAMFQKEAEIPRKLRALWALFAAGGADEPFLVGQLDHEAEYVQAWAIRLMCDGADPSETARKKFVELAGSSKSPLVRMYLASALQRMPVEQRWPLAEALVARGEDIDDHNIPLLLWYGIEPLVPADKTRAIRLTGKSKFPLLRQYLARRVVGE